MRMNRFGEWLWAHWVAGALFMACALLSIAPLAAGFVATPLLLIFLHSPGYMLHQIEEHSGDRFRAFVNERIFHCEALTRADTMWINLPGVWGVNLVALYAAALFGAGWGLAAPYLMLVNALAHVGTAVRVRGYNPGLATSFLIFLPLGAATVALTPATLAQQALGLGVSLTIHAAIIVKVGRRAAALHAGEAAAA